MDGYVSTFKETWHMPFGIKKNGFLKKCNEIWDKASDITEKTFNTQPVFEENYLKNKLKYYNG